jgi:hypothetical protein
VKKEIFIGFVVALIATSFGCFIFIEYISDYDFYRSIELIKEGGLLGKVIVLGAIANFFVFFIFLKKKQVYRARGVLIETFLIAFLVLLLTLFS